MPVQVERGLDRRVTEIDREDLGVDASIDHHVLYQQWRKYVADERLLALVWSYLRRTVCEGGVCEPRARGISLGCPLLPLLGALYLQPFDEQMARLDVRYGRYMDDWVVLASTRWKLRAAVRRVNRVLSELRLEKHPDKTFVGRTGERFDFLGYRFTAAGLRLAAQTKQRFVERVTRLYEQGAAASRIGQYVRHWLT